MKLSKAQLKVLRKMANGWAIKDDLIIIRAEKSGFVLPIATRPTIKALRRLGLIREVGETYPPTPCGVWRYYELTPAGRQALLEAEGAGER